jgi:hypothetical protein
VVNPLELFVILWVFSTHVGIVELLNFPPIFAPMHLSVKASTDERRLENRSESLAFRRAFYAFYAT